MPNVVVMSDTHSSTRYIQLVLSQLYDLKPDCVIHLGDFYDDVNPIVAANFRVIQVPGTWTNYYKRTDIENRVFIDLYGFTTFLTHTPEPHFNDLALDIDPRQVIKNRDADILMHGHTHHPIITVKNDVLILNPGHLYEKDNRGYPPSYAILEFEGAGVQISIKELLTERIVANHYLVNKEKK